MLGQKQQQPDPDEKVTHAYLAEVMQNLNQTLESYSRAINELQNLQRQDDQDRNKQMHMEQTVIRLEREMNDLRAHGQKEEKDQNTAEYDIRRVQQDLQQMQRRLNDTENRLRRIK